MLERAQRFYQKSKILLFSRNYIVPTLKKRVSHPVNEPDFIDDDILLINGAFIMDTKAKQLIEKKEKRRTWLNYQK